LGWTIFYCLFGFVQISDSGCDATADALHCHSLMTLYKTKIITIDLIVFFETISVLNVPLRAMESNPPHSTLVAVAVSNANPSARENRVYSPMKECWSRDDLFTCSERHHSAAAAHRFRPTVCTAALEKGHSDEHSISRGQLTIPLSCSHRPLQRTTAGPSPFFFALLFLRCFQHFSKEKQTENKTSKLIGVCLRTLTPRANQSNYIRKTVKLITNNEHSSSILHTCVSHSSPLINVKKQKEQNESKKSTILVFSCFCQMLLTMQYAGSCCCIQRSDSMTLRSAAWQLRELYSCCIQLFNT